MSAGFGEAGRREYFYSSPINTNVNSNSNNYHQQAGLQQQQQQGQLLSSAVLKSINPNLKNMSKSEEISLRVMQLFMSAVSSVKTLSFYMCPTFTQGKCNYKQQGVMGPVECYSCMSLSYEQQWGALKYVYVKPHSFSDKCNDPFLGKNAIGTVNCSNICVVLKEPQFSAGVYLGHNVIRGCLDRLLVHGFNSSALDTHRFRHFDICRSLKRSSLMNPGAQGFPMQGDVQMCACYGDKCNAGSRLTGPYSPDATFCSFLLFILLPLIILWMNNNYNSFSSLHQFILSCTLRLYSVFRMIILNPLLLYILAPGPGPSDQDPQQSMIIMTTAPSTLHQYYHNSYQNYYYVREDQFDSTIKFR